MRSYRHRLRFLIIAHKSRLFPSSTWCANTCSIDMRPFPDQRSRDSHRCSGSFFQCMSSPLEIATISPVSGQRGLWKLGRSNLHRASLRAAIPCSAEANRAYDHIYDPHYITSHGNDHYRQTSKAPDMAVFSSEGSRIRETEPDGFSNRHINHTKTWVSCSSVMMCWDLAGPAGTPWQF